VSAGQFTSKTPDPLAEFFSLRHSLQSPEMQLTAGTQKCSSKKTACKPIIKLGASPTLQIRMCLATWVKGVTVS